MLDAWRAAGREVAVIGLGKSGVAAARLLRKHGVAGVRLRRGTGPALEEQAALLRAEGVEAEVGRHDLARIAGAAAAVVSPGIAPEAAPVAAARGAGVEVVAESELGLRCLPTTRILAITGTNGKTTTTALTAHLLAAGGLRAASAGNIGRPLSAVALEDAAARLARGGAVVVPAARHAGVVPGGRGADQPRARSPRPVRRPRGVLRRQGEPLSQRHRPPRSGSPTATTPRCAG